MKKTIAVILLLVSAMLFGCMQKAEENPPSQPSGQPQVTTAVEDIAADELAKQIPSGEGNFTELDDILTGMAS